MIHNVEITLSHMYVDQVGKDNALAEALLRAWSRVLYETQPQRIIRLDETIVEAYDPNTCAAFSRAYAYRIRYTFFSE